MGAKTVRRAVFVKNPETQEDVWLYPGDKVPSWATDLITNPLVFQDPDDSGKPPRNAVVEPEEEGEEIEFEEGNLMNLTHAQLDELLEERSLSTNGDKPTKVARLEAYNASQS